MLPVEIARVVPRTLAEVMTRSVITMPPDADVGLLAHTMIKEGIKRIPITEGGRVVGVVSRHDVVRVLGRDDEEIRRELQHFLVEEIETLGRFEVRVDDGVATLIGSPRQPEREVAARAAMAVPATSE
jgi:CBS domain-containing protein